jgi:hypothetical protein
MKEHSLAGEIVTVTANGTLTLPGFSGSAVTALTVAVKSFDALLNLVRNGYAGMLADILDVRVAE